MGGSLRWNIFACPLFEHSDLLRMGFLSSRLGDRRRDFGFDRDRLSMVYLVFCYDRFFLASVVRGVTDHSARNSIVGPGGSNR